MHIDEIIEERCFGSSNKTVYVCWTSRPIWAWEGQLGLAVTMQDAGVSGAGPAPSFPARDWVIVGLSGKFRTRGIAEGSSIRIHA